ncbi:MAG: nickel-dependent lactate racemase [Pseudodesulfovibrio sp.]|uniref:nickel-dependent lactate racemase n=1 Tax=Pseudodesulfovibrio sp. TaxID=2035812 RepID=UPI003D0DCE66
MNISLGYGKGNLQATIDDAHVDAVLTPNDVPVPDDESRLILSALRHPIGTGTITQTFGPGQSVCIVTSDITRPCPSYKLLPPLLEELGEAGVKNDDITIVFALGAHRRHTREEIEHLVGKDIASRYRCIDMDPEDVVLVGVSTRGTPFEVFRPVAEASRRICLGNIEYHYFAGYSGGIKAIVPGVCSRRTIQANHAFMVDGKAATGNLIDNPVRDDLEALLEFLPVDLILNVVLAPDKTVLHAVAGDCIQAHRAGCAFLDTLYRFPLKKAADIVLVTPGGFPKDLNIYQAQKALDNARYAVRQGGVIIWVAACPEGYGSEVFETWLNEARSPDDLIARVKARFQLGGHKAAAIAMAEKKADVYMVSELEDAVMENMFVTPCPDVETALAKARARLGEDASIVIMPFGGSTLPAVEPAP